MIVAIAFALFLRFLQVRGLADAQNRVVRGGVEPPTFRFSGGRSYQLSYLTSTGIRVSPRHCRGHPADRSGPDGI